MTKIRFRAWDNVGKCIFDWNCIWQTAFNQEGISMMYRILTNQAEQGDNHGYHLMQFTNHQIHDVDLYAGDIIRNEKMDDYEDAVEYLVCTYILEWAMFGLLTIDEYHKYNSEGAEALDEYMFWTFPIDDKENEQRRICGNIYETPNLLSL